MSRTRTDDQERRQRASYLAKYSTKSTEQAGGLQHRVHRGEVEHVYVREHVRGFLRAAFELHDQVSEAIAADEPVERVSALWSAPATSSDPNGLLLSVVAAMSSGERVLVRLQDGTEHVGQITRRTSDGQDVKKSSLRTSG